MRTFPEDDDDRKDAERARVEPWMLDAIRLNPDYPHWGPYEDYMCDKDSGWHSPVITECWEDHGFGLDELNEVVNFYFYAERESQRCAACAGSGLNPSTHAISEDFYAFDKPRGAGWSDKITQDEVDALVEKGRLCDFTRNGHKPTAAEVNAAQAGGFLRGSHDAINRWILIETRAKRLGVYGKCAQCEGYGDTFTADKARLGVVLWVLHPRKGASRGVDIKNVTQAQLPEVFAYLAEAAQRNADRFRGITSQLVGA